MMGNGGTGAGGRPALFHFGWVRRPLALFALWWVGLQAFALLAFARVRLAGPDEAYTWTSQIRDVWPVVWHGFVALHAHFDSGFYERIAVIGYEADTAAFLPLYPGVVGTVWRLFCGWLACTPTDAAFVVANVCALGAAIAVYRLALLDGDAEYAARALWYFLLFPTAFFLSANYTEAMFVLLAAMSLLAARRARWGVAALLCAAAVLTRSVGLAVWVALLAEWWGARRDHPRAWLWLAPVPLAFAAFEWTLNARGLSFFDTQYRLFQRAPWNLWSLPDNLDWAHLIAYPAAQANLLLDAALGTLAVVAGVVSVTRWRASYGLFGALCILIPLSSGHTLGLGRFTLAAFTVPMALARLGRDSGFDRGYTLVAGLLLGFYTFLFVQGYWAG